MLSVDVDPVLAQVLDPGGDPLALGVVTVDVVVAAADGHRPDRAQAREVLADDHDLRVEVDRAGEIEQVAGHHDEVVGGRLLQQPVELAQL